jgi:hypothetical protein
MLMHGLANVKSEQSKACCKDTVCLEVVFFLSVVYICIYIYVYIYILCMCVYSYFILCNTDILLHFSLRGAATQLGPWPPHSRGFYITHHDAPQSVGLLWTSDQLDAVTSARHYKTVTTEKHACPRWDSNPQSQQARGRRPTP